MNGEPCIPGPGYRSRTGYTQTTVNGRRMYAHRAVYEAEYGPIPPGLVIDHLCKVRDCVNPRHMEAVPQRINVHRGDSFSAVNRTKTECVSGHPYDEANTYWRPDGKRDCRTCRAIRNGKGSR